MQGSLWNRGAGAQRHKGSKAKHYKGNKSVYTALYLIVLLYVKFYKFDNLIIRLKQAINQLTP
ncbi:MAG TPA: hypothetical protein DDW27_18065 [Bacteroidales bacterium]|nr:hypothetical protein [Bacteroidales bacterium]